MSLFLLLVLIRASLHLVSTLPVNSIANWANLEKKFQIYFYTRTGEKNITNLTTIRQKSNESGTEFLQRFRETRNLCFSLNLADDQLGRLKFNMPRKMKVDDNPFLRDQNMVDAGLLKGKTKVLIVDV